MIDRELYLPQEWIEDEDRCEAVGVPKETVLQTNPQMALTMLKRADIVFNIGDETSEFNLHDDAAVDYVLELFLSLWLK